MDVSSSCAGSAVSSECVVELLETFFKCFYRAKADKKNEVIHKRCLHLLAADYRVEVIENRDGWLCAHYPTDVFILEAHLHSPSVRVARTEELRDLFSSARFARVRSRFVVPVLLYRNKNVCRSATLSTMIELYGRSGVDWLFTGRDGSNAIGAVPANARIQNEDDHAHGLPSADDHTLNRVRGQDVELLKRLGVTLICDLMVEKKKTKYGLTVSSSEKVDKASRYSDFHIASMPYPGCEFFRDYKMNGYNPTSLVYNWIQPGVDAVLSIPTHLKRHANIPFQSYQQWSLVEVTQNYLKLLLWHLHHGEGGVLVHCISGWDRTPLFISLLRLSLWADGVAHSSLTACEMLYLTLAFDWYTYGHQLKQRYDNGEEIMYFCFDFLKYITSEEFSVKQINRDASLSMGTELEDMTGFSPHCPHSSHTASCPELSASEATPTHSEATPTHSEATPTHREATPPSSCREGRLRQVRELFCDSYRRAEVTESIGLNQRGGEGGGGGGGGGEGEGVLAGLFNRLARAVWPAQYTSV